MQGRTACAPSSCQVQRRFGGTARLVHVHTGSSGKEQKAPRARSPREERSVPLWAKGEIRFSSPSLSQQPGRSWVASTGAGVEAWGDAPAQNPRTGGRAAPMSGSSLHQPPPATTASGPSFAFPWQQLVPQVHELRGQEGVGGYEPLTLWAVPSWL